MLSRTTPVFRFLYFINQLCDRTPYCYAAGLTILFGIGFIYNLIISLAVDDEYFTPSQVLFAGMFIFAMVWLIAFVISLFKKDKPRIHYLNFREVVDINYHATKYKTGFGTPCVRATISYDSYDRITGKDKIDTVEYRLYTYLDFEERFSNPGQKIEEILRSAHCTDDGIGWVFPYRYRTKWGDNRNCAHLRRA